MPHARSVECKCESNFTCGYCLRNAKPYLFTPSSVMVHVDTPPIKKEEK